MTTTTTTTDTRAKTIAAAKRMEENAIATVRRITETLVANEYLDGSRIDDLVAAQARRRVGNHAALIAGEEGRDFVAGILRYVTSSTRVPNSTSVASVEDALATKYAWIEILDVATGGI
jgi:hypothetical protein